MRFLYIFLLLSFSLQAQIQDSTKTKPVFADFLKKSTVKGQWRNFYLLTDNEKSLTDYQTLATGFKLQYSSAIWKGFQLSTGFSYVMRVFEQNILKPDPVTLAKSRYEIGLYDVANPQKKNDIYLLNELTLRYTSKYGKIIFGKQLLKTPFINPQDGRMMPTYAEGLYIESSALKNWTFEAGFIYKIAARGVSQWSFVDKSIGIYPVGVQNNGAPSQYSNQLSSKGLGFIGIEKRFNRLKIKAFDMGVDNIMNSAFLQTDIFIIQDSIQQLQISAQGIRQDGLGNGGNTEANKSYFQKNGKSMTLGGRLQYHRRAWEFSLNYNRITKDGRFLNPREWGIEPFFTFLPRERSDGFADVHAYSVKMLWTSSLFKSSLGLAYVQLPDVKNFAHNKYGMPAYYQANVECKFIPKGFFKGLELTMLLVYKKNAVAVTDPKYIINKVNLLQINLISNYNF